MAPDEEQTFHASAVLLGRHGVLIEGPSGSGKSMLAHRLIARYRGLGKSAFWVSDDRTIVRLLAGHVVATPPPALAGLAELHFGGIQEVEYVPSAIIDLVVALRPESTLDRMPEEAPRHQTLPLALVMAPQRAFERAMALINARLAAI